MTCCSLACGLALWTGAGVAASQAANPGVTKSVVILEAHPGEMAGCIGMTMLLKQKGYRIHVVDVTYGSDGATPGACAEEERKACAELGATLHFLGREKGGVFADKALCFELSDLFREIRPAAVLTHWPIDTDIDRVVTGGSAFKSLSMAGRYGMEPLTQLYFFETLCGSLNFRPLYYVYTNHVLADAAKVLACYDKAKLAPDLSALHDYVNEKGRVTATAKDPTTLRAWECWPHPKHAEAYAAHDNYVYAHTTKNYYPLPIFAEISSAFGKELK